MMRHLGAAQLPISAGYFMSSRYSIGRREILEGFAAGHSPPPRERDDSHAA